MKKSITNSEFIKAALEGDVESLRSGALDANTTIENFPAVFKEQPTGSSFFTLLHTFLNLFKLILWRISEFIVNVGTLGQFPDDPFNYAEDDFAYDFRSGVDGALKCGNSWGICGHNVRLLAFNDGRLSALTAAMFSGKLEAVEYLLEHGANYKEIISGATFRCSLMTGVYDPHVYFTSNLLDFNLLSFAVFLGNETIFKTLLKKYNDEDLTEALNSSLTYIEDPNYYNCYMGRELKHDLLTISLRLTDHNSVSKHATYRKILVNLFEPYIKQLAIIKDVHFKILSYYPTLIQLLYTITIENKDLPHVQEWLVNVGKYTDLSYLLSTMQKLLEHLSPTDLQNFRVALDDLVKTDLKCPITHNTITPNQAVIVTVMKGLTSKKEAKWIIRVYDGTDDDNELSDTRNLLQRIYYGKSQTTHSEFMSRFLTRSIKCDPITMLPFRAQPQLFPSINDFIVLVNPNHELTNTDKSFTPQFKNINADNVTIKETPTTPELRSRHRKIT